MSRSRKGFGGAKDRTWTAKVLAERRTEYEQEQEGLWWSEGQNMSMNRKGFGGAKDRT